jgi:hypothetical protein
VLANGAMISGLITRNLELYEESYQGCH